jgi:hypothetical protein
VDEPSADEKEAARDPLERAADLAVEALSSAPALALVAAVAALCELGLARVIWHGLTDVIDAPELLELRRWARFPRNLAAVAGLGTLLVGLAAFLRFPGHATIGRRLVVAAFSGVFVPTVVVAALVPAEMLRRRLVIFGLAAANVLVTLFAMTAVRYRPEPALRIAVGLAAATAFLTLTVVGLGQLAQAEGTWESAAALLNENANSTEQVLLGMRHAGELAWLGVMIAAGVVAVWDRDENVLRARVLAAVGLTFVFAIAIIAFGQLAGHRFRFMLFGSFRLGLFVDDWPAVYALPLALALAGAVLALARRELRQLGAGVLLWLAAGFGPHTPIQLLYLVLGALLLTRTAQARDPRGAWRTKNPWARWLRASVPPHERLSDPESVAPSSAE